MNDKTKKTDRPLPTVEEVRALLDYDPETGLFRWLKTAGRGRAGEVAGTLHRLGYTRIKIDGRFHLAHRLAYLWVRGTWPQHQIDHADGIRSNNALANLREATRAENNQNRAKQRRPTSSRFLGVCLDKAKGRWRAAISCNGKRQHLGYFATPEEAYTSYLAAKAQLHTAQPVPRANAYDHR
jgi:hypothetical protein